MRQRPTLPNTFAYSTIGPAGLNLRRLEGVSEPGRAGAFCRNPERILRGISASREKGKGQTDFSVRPLLMRQRPTLPHTFAYSTIGPAGLNFRVRDGNGWNPRGMITANLPRLRRVPLAIGTRTGKLTADFFNARRESGSTSCCAQGILHAEGSSFCR